MSNWNPLDMELESPSSERRTKRGSDEQTGGGITNRVTGPSNLSGSELNSIKKDRAQFQGGGCTRRGVWNINEVVPSHLTGYGRIPWLRDATAKKSNKQLS